jgi:hypothetical protein
LDFKNPIVDRKLKNYADILRNGWQCIFPNCKDNQPLLFNFLEGGMGKVLVAEKTYRIKIIDVPTYKIAGFVGSDAFGYAVVEPYFKEGSIFEKEEKHSCFSRFMSLPHEIAETYYARVAGLEAWGGEMGDAMQSREMPSIISKWADIDSIINENVRGRAYFFLNSIRKNISVGAEVINDFSIILDSRPIGSRGFEGDVLFVQEGVHGGPMYHLRNMDWTAIRRVDDPVALYDSYVTFMFSGGEGRLFDFSKFSKEFVLPRSPSGGTGSDNLS